MGFSLNPFAPIFDLVGKLIPDQKAKAEALQRLEELRQNGELETLKAQMSGILAEAQSEDKWTSRARPSFMYVMYAMLLWALPFSIFWAINPEAGKHMAEGLQYWLAAIPTGLYQLFGVGYVGYAAARSYDKAKSQS